MRAAVRATCEEAHCLLAAYEALPRSDATDNREVMGWEEFREWRAPLDLAFEAGEVL